MLISQHKHTMQPNPLHQNSIRHLMRFKIYVFKWRNVCNDPLIIRVSPFTCTLRYCKVHVQLFQMIRCKKNMFVSANIPISKAG